MILVSTPKTIFSIHIVQRMFERNISARTVHQTLEMGETIEGYSSEMPMVKLVLGCSNVYCIIPAHDDTYKPLRLFR